MDELSHDDLIEYALELQRQIDQKEDEIAELTQSQTGGKGKGKRGNFSDKEELDALETENEDLRTQVEAGQIQISELREQVSNTNVKLTALKNEKVESDKKIKAQTKRLEELEKEIIEVNNRGRSAELQSKEFNKQKSANVKEAQRLWEENESLKEEIKQLEGQLTGAEEEKAFMESLIAKFADEKDELAAKVDAADVEMDEMQQAHIEVEKLLEETQLRLQASNVAEGELEQRIATLEGELRAVQEKSALENKTHISEVKGLKEQIAVLKDSTKVGEKQRALETLQAETADNTKLIDELHTSLESALQERDLLSEKLLELEHSIEQKVADRIATERNKAKELALTIESLKAHHEDNLEHYSTLEAEKALLVREVDELTSWKAVYEAGHGLQEMARNQKKLKDDNRRLSVAVEQYNNKLSMVLDANGILTQAFEKLKKETGKPADFFYPEFSLQTEVQSVNASLQYQLRELEEQVVGLENENTRIRSAMKNQAASIGEQGFKYAGMSPDMLLQVNDFATSLREGRVELPLNDRSQVLLKENRSLRQDIDGMKLRLERYERELGGAVYSGAPAPLTATNAANAGLNNNNSSDVSAGANPNPVAADMARLASENHALHTKMNALQSDLTQLLQNSAHKTASNSSKTNAAGDNNNTIMPVMSADNTNTSNGMISVAELSNILIQNNQLMMRELNSLRQSNNNLSNNNHYAQYGTNPPQDTVLQHIGSGKSVPLTAAMNRAQASYRGSASGAPATPAAAGSNTVTFNVPPATSPRPPGANNNNSNNNNSNPLWTPAIARGGMPFGSGAAGIPFGTPYPGAATPGGPATPHGKSLLQNTLTQLNLPPEEWALDVRDLHTQLVECLEQLYSREQELEDTHSVVSTLETQLVAIKQQMTSLYYDYALKSEQYETHTASLHTEAAQLNEERDDLRLKLRRMTDMAQLLQAENPTTLTSTLTDLTRKVTIYEVNEAVLSRKFIAQSEQLTQEQQTRQALESDFIEMETSLKKRILYLEQYKLAASARIANLQGRVDSSVSSADYTALQAEIDSLREDHLNTLRREVEARMSALHTLDQARELRSAKIIIAHLNADLQAASAGKTSVEAELQHQKEVTARALQTSHSSVEVSQLVSELARFRGEASRLEVELMGANRRCELITQRVDDVTRQCEVADNRVRELETRMDELHAKETAARKSALETALRFEGGLTRAQAEDLQSLHNKTQLALDEAKREVVRHKELALIATEQAQALHTFKKNHETELTELKEYCTKLEARTDDDLLIGKLQRKLMSTTTSYRAFTRKYQQAREAMRRRELGMRALEGRLDEQDRAVMKTQEANRLEVSALKKALLNLKNTVFESGDAAQSHAASNNKDMKEEKKKAKIRTLAKSGFATVTVGSKLIDISQKVDTLAGQATDAVQRAATAEDTVRTLQGQIEDLLCDKAILTQQTTDLMALTSNKAKQKTLAQRLITLSDEVRTNKIAFLQQRRAVQVLRQEKRHLQSIISNIEADVMELEVNKVNSETRAVLFDIQDTTDVMEGEFSEELLGLSSGEEKNGNGGGSSGKKGNKDNHKSLDGAASDFPHREPIEYQTSSSNKKGKNSDDTANDDTRLSLDMDLISDNNEGGLSDKHITPEQLYRKLHNANTEHAATRRELSDFKLRTSNLQHEVSEVSALLQEKEGQVAYYERVLQQEGLPALIMPHSGNAGHHLSHNNNNNRHSGPSSNSRPHRLMQDEQEKLQEAASVTIGSLRALLEEKNAIIERHRNTIDRLTQAGSGAGNKSRADKRADDLLDRLNHEAGEEARARRYGVALHPEVFSQGIGGATEAERTHLKQLLTQIEAADGIILEKDNTIQALEHKLLAEQNTRERAELRCGESLKEANAMKEDMLLLVQQLQDERAKNRHLSTTHNARTLLPTYPTSTLEATAPIPQNNTQVANKLADAQKLLKTKETKLKQYHAIIITLKEEFIKLERDKAEQEVLWQNKLQNTAGRSNISNNNNAANQDDIRHMQDTIAALRSKLTACDGDLKKAKHIMEVLRNDKNTFQKQAEEMEKETVEAQKKCDNAQQGYHRLRKELEDARKKEIKYRERLKAVNEMSDTQALAKDRIEALEREVDVLKAQNAALSRTHEEVNKSHKDGAVGGGKTEGGGQLLGTGPGGPIDETRRLQADKWAEDQKLKKRVNVLQSRLAEMQSANEDLQTQVSKGRENLQSALQAKDELNRKVQAGARAVQETKRMTADDLSEIEQAHSRIFSLEEELVGLRRKAHVEQANEIAALSHQISSQRARILELEGEIADSEMRRKRAGAGSGGGGRSLRDDEEAFLREERLKDDLDLSRRQKLELEAALLDRDARAIESKFDLESSELEVVRLKRRVKELEQAYKSLSTLNSGSGSAGGGGAGAGAKGQTHSSTPGTGSKKEQELEGVIEALKRVIDRLKAENDRLSGTKKGISGGTTTGHTSTTGAAGDFERKYQHEKKRAEALEAENKTLTDKMRGHDESSQKIVQRQQQIALLRKQLASKAEEIAALKEANEGAIVERETIKRKASGLQDRINELEIQLHKASTASRAPVSSNNNNANNTAELQELKARIGTMSTENDTLKMQLHDLRKSLKNNTSAPAQAAASAASTSSSNINSASVQAELTRVKEENVLLRKELSAFDIDFFEEIENLKYAHAEAIRKLKMYEQQGAGSGGASGAMSGDRLGGYRS